MLRGFLWLLFLCASASAQTSLSWKNGDQLKGAILPSKSGYLMWQSPHFKDPFSLELTHLDHIGFKQSGESDQTGPFRITFQNGDRIFGDLIAIDRYSVTFQCPKLSQTVVLDRSVLNRIERVSGSHLRYSGPIELDDWKPLGERVEKEDWYIRKTGEFVSHRWCGELFRELELPEKVEVSFSITCPNERPFFEVGFLESSKEGPRIETWDDTLVLTSGNQFQPIMELKDERVINLRVFWDRAREVAKVCDANGDLLASLDGVKFVGRRAVTETSRVISGSRSSDRRSRFRTGFRILNRTSRIDLSYLSVREWDGESIARFDASKPRVELSGGNVRLNLRDFELAQNGTLSAGSEVLAIEDLDQMVFSTQRLNQDITAQSRLYWHDGSVISGEFLGLNTDVITLSPSWLTTEIKADLNNAKEIRFPDHDKGIIEMPDRILSSTTLDLGGVLSPGSNESQGTLFAWRPLGAINASPLADGEEFVIERGDFPGDNEVLGDTRIYLKNDEVLACKLVSIDKDGLRFTSSVTGETKISHDQIRAIDIEGAGLIPTGFADSGWLVKPTDSALPDDDPRAKNKDKETVEIEKDKVTIKRGGFGHMNIMAGDRIKFRTEWDNSYGGGVFTLRLFCSDFETAPSTDILIAVQPKRVLVGEVKPGGSFNFSNGQVAIDRPLVDFEILATQDKLQVLVNGNVTLELDNDSKKVSGNGLVFQMGGGWIGWSENPSEMKFSNFSVERSSGYLPRTFINPVAKRNALLIPRFHRESPPTHILVAPNGDLLRGQLRSAQENAIAFTSRGTNIDVPKSRVSAIIWLNNPAIDLPDEEVAKEKQNDAGPEVTFHPTHYIVMKDGSRLLLESKKIVVEDEVFVGHSDVLGECRVPLATINRSNVLISASPLSRPISSDQLAYRDWVTARTIDPAIPKQGDSGSDSEMIGKAAPKFKIPMLDGGEFNLADKKGRVVVLDFWATWCGPCIKAMPEVLSAVEFFKGRPVEFCAINQAETGPLISKFLELRKWPSGPVGLDFELTVGREYEVKGIPHTVVIGKDGKVAWVHTGFSPELGQKLATAIAKELAK